MPARTPTERALVGQIAARERWAKTRDRVAATKPARDGRRAKIGEQLTAELGPLPPEELERRIVRYGRRAHGADVVEVCAGPSSSSSSTRAPARRG
jgi:hypothetical protein